MKYLRDWLWCLQAVFVFLAQNGVPAAFQKEDSEEKRVLRLKRSIVVPFFFPRRWVVLKNNHPPERTIFSVLPNWPEKSLESLLDPDPFFDQPLLGN